jgi:hypothetical protein
LKVTHFLADLVTSQIRYRLYGFGLTFSSNADLEKVDGIAVEELATLNLGYDIAKNEEPVLDKYTPTKDTLSASCRGADAIPLD